ncbi:hypothetical protein OIN60_07815 [Paenibacillus sp. P96]|uniref:YtxH domain-containing protein n=1 Tax=Paenibacillus zeirhizosphaerae TaxID=2987519 RepID=A0ABT9FPN6_9BACL|nr:hypothetical protein [Paenibacillus sp. P96]MDP4096675.1 hypothetical protein [Paenibacillus sp. P96]
MKTSSFFLGVLLGAAATSLMARKGGSALLGSVRNGDVGGMMEKAKSKLMDAALPGIEESQHKTSMATHAKHAGDKVKNRAYSSSEKEENIKMLKEFIRNSPDVKREVEQILKETHTAVPGI